MKLPRCQSICSVILWVSAVHNVYIIFKKKCIFYESLWCLIVYTKLLYVHVTCYIESLINKIIAYKSSVSCKTSSSNKCYYLKIVIKIFRTMIIFVHVWEFTYITAFNIITKGFVLLKILIYNASGKIRKGVKFIGNCQTSLKRYCGLRLCQYFYDVILILLLN